VSEEVVERLRITPLSHLCHALDVPSVRLEQSAQVLLRLRVDITGPQSEEKRKFLAEGQEPIAQSLQGRSWGMAFLLLITGLAEVA
jgi:hypothetical protein